MSSPETDRLLRHLPTHVAGWGRLWGLPRLEERLEVSFSGRLRRSLGRYHAGRHAVALAGWLADAPRALLVEVLCHEAAHAAVQEIHGRGPRPHGNEWRDLMRAAGYEPRVRIPVDSLPRRLRLDAPTAVLWQHRCPVCHMIRSARRAMPRWRCSACREAGLDGRLVITSRPTVVRVDS